VTPKELNAVPAEPPIVSLRRVTASTGSHATLEAHGGLITAELCEDVLRVCTQGLDPVDIMFERLRHFTSVLLGPDRGCRGEIQVELALHGVSRVEPPQ
jgi:hypothetical protein